MQETSSWSDLPQCLLELILKRLTKPPSLHFSSVCRSWCITQRQCPRTRGLPFMIFYRSSCEKGFVEILSLFDKRTYKMPVCELVDRSSCLSSSDGWMLLQSINRYKTLLVKDKERVTLPRDRRRFHYLDCLFFSTPSDPDGVLFVRKSNNTFLLYRLCDRQFHEHEWKGSVVVSNTIFHEGKLYTFSFEKERKRKLNALIDEDWSRNDENWSLAVIDPLFPGNTTTMKMKLKLGNRTQVLPTPEHHVFVLVESRGEILLVRMMGNCIRRLSCDVFRADLSKMEWIKLEHLGDQMLFLSEGSSVSVCASEMGREGNRIYFAPRMCEANERTEGSYVEFELGRDGVTTHSISKMFPWMWSSCVICSAWLTPCDL